MIKLLVYYKIAGHCYMSDVQGIQKFKVTVKTQFCSTLSLDLRKCHSST